MRILFINPQSLDPQALSVPPLGLLYIASFIRKNGFKDIEVVDDSLLKLPTERLEAKIKNADVIAVTGSTCQFKYAAEIAEICHKHNKLSIIGGPHATPIPEDILKNSRFDVVVRCEGELTFLDILRKFKEKDFSNIKGISYKKDGKIVHNEDREFIKDLDVLPFPARDLVHINDYPTQKLARFRYDRYTNLISSRGCLNACIFCSSPITWRRTIRLRSAKNVFEEILELHNKYGFKCLHFHDDTFTASRKRVFELCDMIIKEKLDLEWSCITRPDKTDYELYKKMAEAGCKQVDLGIESGSEKLLEIAKKNYNLKQIKDSLDSAKKAGLLRHGFFLIGLPGENIFTFLKTIAFAKSLNLDSSVWTVLLPFPGTEVFNNRLVKIIDADYVNWLYKKPIRQGFLAQEA